jgi:ubiquinone/menaquinone biosynthesis C-methylase UbiE
VRRSYDAIADRYDEYVGYAERFLLGNGRRWVGAQAHGDVLEIGVGTGRNFPFYASDVRLTGIDLIPAMLQQARDRAATLGIDADLRLGDAQALDLPDDRFDAVVMTLVLSGVPDIQRAIAEAHRVLRHGGRLLVLDFVRSPWRSVRVVQRLLNPLMGRRYSFHLLSDPLDHLADAGFVVVRVTRSKAGIVERVAARKPSPAGRRRVLNPGGAFRDLVPHNDI